MERDDRSKISYQVEIPINGWIFIEHDGKEVGNVTFHLDNGVFSAKTNVDVEGSVDGIEFIAIKRVNEVLDKVAFETGASIRIEKNGIKAKRISEPIENPTGEVIDAMESIIIKLEPHAINEDTLIEAAKLGSNLMQSDYENFQKSLSHYRNGLNAESDGNPNAFLDFWKSIEVIAGHYGKGRCLFSWDDVSESDRGKLTRYLIDEFEIEWVKNAEITKLDNDDRKTIHICKDKNSVEIRIDEKAGKVILITSDFRTHYLKAKKENGKLNIYGNKIKDKICDCFKKCFGERKDDEVNELNKVRIVVAHGKKNVSDPAIIKIMIEKTSQIKNLAKLFLSCWVRTSRLRMPRNSELEYELLDGCFTAERLGAQLVVIGPERNHDQKSELDV